MGRAMSHWQARQFEGDVVKILFCSPVQHSKELGGSKVVIELAEEMGLLGWDCQVLCPSDISAPNDADPLKSFHVNLRDYLKRHATEYSVVDYDHAYLPYARDEFNQGTLFVARSVLLAHHLATIPIPQPTGVKAAIGRVVNGRERQRKRQKMICRAHTTIEGADLVNVSNDEDKAELIRQGVSAEKVIVIPYGISRVLRPLFDQVSSAPPSEPIVAFVGTFDYRKGAKEFPKIVWEILKQVPGVRFRLLGVKGLFQTQQEVLAHFPKKVAQRVEIVLQYAPEDLPSLLAPCSVGIFPSYMEGMPFGVLEMMAASLPVIAYDAPGPPMVLPAEYLTPRGNANAMSKKVVSLLHNRSQLQAARVRAKKRSQAFSWQHAARVTHETYIETLDMKSRRSPTKL